ncbi:Type I restriction-modification system methyltransferase subunit [Anaerobiospirillum thomasii]|uniref:site-specific DNA-methyltransferase (adenine-specific) n=1 Tax=Anaerobiospirillum thomasii TaxID=179995 RepID=A0A2X0V7P9_9GAMM|nr:Type I restriction-modification system methyltransferase subunit [Anaerobiospirillum thomasii]
MAKKEKDIAALMYDFVQSIKVNYMPEAFFKGLMQIYGCSLDYLERALSNDRAVNVGSEIVNESMARSDLALSQMVYFRFLKKDEDVEESFNQVLELKEIKSSKNKIQFIICAGPATLYIYDRISDDSLSIETEDLSGNYLFLMPLIEGRKQTIVSNKEADKRACTKLTRLLDVLANHNNIEHDQMHKLNSFIRRILFCLFAEDTGIFSGKENIFTNAFNTFVDKKGSNARAFFEHLFLVLNTKEEDRENLKNRIPELFMAFPYVNGGLFRDTGFIPEFNVAARNQFIDCGRLTWRDISPAIFGSMFQSAMDRDARRTLGAHYTSEENILKIIKPLFLDDLYAEFEQLKENTKHIVDKIEAMPLLKNKRKTKRAGYSDYISEEAIKLDLERKQYFKDFLLKIGSLKFLDPACGCGNFLLIAYKELRELENAVLEYINEGNFTNSHISINQFYGIEIEDWPAEIAHVSMWLMQHLMNKETNIRFGTNIESIPLKTSATIVTDNALTTDWNDVLKATECSYILGNPPFSGSVTRSKEQKEWLQSCYPPKYKISRVDFVTAWFVKASDYMQSNKNIECAFVATNSICQGQQVETLWGLLLNKGININFAYSSFPWTNEATGKAAVTCVITGFSYKDKKGKTIYSYDFKEKSIDRIKCTKISPYLFNCTDISIIKRENSPLSARLNLSFGNMPNDNGNLLFEYKEGREFLHKYPEAKPYIKKFIGSSELMKSEFRYCLWLTEKQKNEWSQIPSIM